MTLAGITRISDGMKSSLLLSSLRNVQLQYTQVQQQLATGDKLLAPSDDAPAASKVMSLDRIMQLNDQIAANLDNTMSYFNMTDTALATAGTTVTDAWTLAHGSIGKTASEQQTNAGIIQSYIDSMLEAANTRVGDIYVFGGVNSTGVPFVSEADGIRYNGAFATRQANLGGVDTTSLGLLGTEAFGIDETTIAGSADISPAMTAATRISTLSGTLGRGIRLDSIRITDGIIDVNVDLTGCDRVGDIVDRINQAGAGAINCSISADGQGFDIVGTLPGSDLKVLESNAGYAARDLGLYNTTGGAAGYTGGDVHPRLTVTTRLSDLNGGAGVDLSSGLAVSNGGKSEVFTFDTDETVGDLLNRINHSDMGIRASINAAGDGFDITNLICGADLHVGENGGTTAADLGIRSLTRETKLASFRDDRGVRLSEGKTDLLIRLSDSTELEVDLDGAETLGDVIDKINQASAAAGLTLTAAEKTTGNGIELTDAAGGAEALFVQSINSSSAAEDLGIAGTGVGATLTGEDTYDRRTGGVFDDLIRLRDAMYVGDDAEMTFLAGKLQSEDELQVDAVRSRMGGLIRDLNDRADRNVDMKTQDEKLKSLLFDTDYYEAVSRYTQLESALQANMMTSSSMLNLSLLNYLS